jgi:hypothetical protein
VAEVVCFPLCAGNNSRGAGDGVLSKHTDEGRAQFNE